MHSSMRYSFGIKSTSGFGILSARGIIDDISIITYNEAEQ